jgi:hypothetical protein
MKTQIQKLKSSKLFYNKWPYKVECRQVGASRVVHSGIDAVREWCATGKGMFVSSLESRLLDKAVYLEFANLVAPYIGNPDVKIRVEGSHFNLFCIDKSVLETIDKDLNKWIRKISGPTTDEELEFLLSNGHKKILRDVLPKEKYKYRIYFKSKFPADKRISFITWADKYGDKLDISDTSRRWLLGSRYYTQDPFMYVEDDKMLSMTGIYLSGYVKKVEEFILRDTAFSV